MTVELSYWRAFSPTQLAGMKNVEKSILDMLVQCTDPDQLPDPDLLHRALDDDATAMWQIGATIGRDGYEPGDVAMSWLLLAAVRNHAGATVALCFELVELGRQLTDAGTNFGGFEVEARPEVCTPARLNRLALDWSRYIGPFLRRRSEIAEELLVSIDERSLIGRVWKAPGPTSRARLRVVDEIGEPSSKEGRHLALVYGELTKPLPLAESRAPLDVVETALAMEFPTFVPVIHEIMMDARLMATGGNPWVRLRPMLLLGPPGIGKTRFAQRLAALFGIGYEIMSAAGTIDNRMLAGTARGWSTVQPSFPILAIKRSGIANPLLVVDEVEKCVAGRNGSIHATLLGLLERESSRRFLDEALLAICDLSQISWVLTANSLIGIPAPLLSRVQIHDLTKLGPADDDAMIDRIIQDIATEYGIELGHLPEIDAADRARLHQALSRGASVRRIRATIAGYLARSDVSRSVH